MRQTMRHIGSNPSSQPIGQTDMLTQYYGAVAIPAVAAALAIHRPQKPARRDAPAAAPAGARRRQ